MPIHPRIYEINTRVWLQQLSIKLNRQINLDNIPPQEWLKIRNLGCDWVWLMGVWQKSLISQKLARKDSYLQTEYSKISPYWSDEDIVGSPYAIKDYSLNYNLGNNDSIDYAKEVMHHYGIKLMLDFVPNHTACDHYWVWQHPQYYIWQQEANPKTNISLQGKNFAFGKDPNYDPWKDTLQLNYFNQETRQTLIEELLKISQYCDGVRCDMAMLVTNDIFSNTWKRELNEMGFTKPKEEFWSQAISQIKSKRADFQFVAECYWNTEKMMQEQGFDFTYDKVLYDMLLDKTSKNINNYLTNQLNPEKWLRFIENHDEKRAATEFGLAKSQAAIILISFLPGATLIYQGQENGFKIKLPVQLITQPEEESNEKLMSFYRKLGNIVQKIFSSTTQSYKVKTCGWPDNNSFENLIVVGLKNDKHIYIIVINYSDIQSQGKIYFNIANNSSKLLFIDMLNNQEYIYHVEKIENEGLFVDLGPWQSHVFEIA